jgi:hypothetical protein
LLLFTALQPRTSVQVVKTLIAAGAASRLALLVQGLGARPARAHGLGAGFDVNLVRFIAAHAHTALERRDRRMGHPERRPGSQPREESNAGHADGTYDWARIAVSQTPVNRCSRAFVHL